jgi:hypothetical protein
MPNINNYNDALNFINYNGPNYIPVKNYRDFTIDVYIYYNQYYASPKETQNRRIMRNYLNNQASIKKSNINPFINNKNKKFNFVYGNGQTYMVVQNENKSIDIFININKFWCLQKHFNSIDCNELALYLKNIAVKEYTT